MHIHSADTRGQRVPDSREVARVLRPWVEREPLGYRGSAPQRFFKKR